MHVRACVRACVRAYFANDCSSLQHGHPMRLSWPQPRALRGEGKTVGTHGYAVVPDASHGVWSSRDRCGRGEEGVFGGECLQWRSTCGFGCVGAESAHGSVNENPSLSRMRVWCEQLCHREGVDEELAAGHKVRELPLSLL